MRVPLFDLRIASRRTFWVAALGGLIVFGTLMGAMFIGQQYMQNVLGGYSTLAAGATILPAAGAMVIVAPQSAKLVQSMGSRFTLLAGYAFIVLGLVFAMLTWDEGAHFWHVGLVYVLVGIGVGLAGTPGVAVAHRIGARPAGGAWRRACRICSATSAGGAILQSTLGAILTAGYASQLQKTIASSPQADQVSHETEAALTKSFSSAEVLAERYPQYADQIIGAARDAFVHGGQPRLRRRRGDRAGGCRRRVLLLPKHEGERAAMAEYAKQRSL